MELLLLLSAFLTALTGAITGVRPVQGAAAQQVGLVSAMPARRVAAKAAIGVRPVQGWLRLARAWPATVVIRVVAAVPTFGQRRRE